MIAQLVAEARQLNDRGHAGGAPLDSCSAVLDGSSSAPGSDTAVARMAPSGEPADERGRR
jgi:hypothetical protein